MKFFTTAFLLAALFPFIGGAALADNSTKSMCDASKPVELSNNIKYTLADLNSRIDKVRTELGTHITRHFWRTSRFSKLERQLGELEGTKQDVVDKMYLSGCTNLREEASTEARLDQLEKTVAQLKASNIGANQISDASSKLMNNTAGNM